MGKTMIKETMSKSVQGILNFDEEDLVIEVDGFEDPQKLRELFKLYNGRNVKITMTLNVDIT